MKKKWLLFLSFVFFSGTALTNEQLPELHHRSNLVMPETMLIPASLTFEETPAKRQKVICKTCHGIKDIQDKDFDTVDKHQDNFIRNGPYEPLSDFCYLCHKQKQNQPENIHILLDSSLVKGKQKKEQQCLYCHTEILEQKEPEQALLIFNDDKNQDLKLRLPVEKICYGCHLRTPHLNAIEHQVAVKDEMLSYLQHKLLTRGVFHNLPLHANLH